jgi:hypothetical protein
MAPDCPAQGDLQMNYSLFEMAVWQLPLPAASARLDSKGNVDAMNTWTKLPPIGFFREGLVPKAFFNRHGLQRAVVYVG